MYSRWNNEVSQEKNKFFVQFYFDFPEINEVLFKRTGNNAINAIPKSKSIVFVFMSGFPAPSSSSTISFTYTPVFTAIKVCGAMPTIVAKKKYENGTFKTGDAMLINLTVRM